MFCSSVDNGYYDYNGTWVRVKYCFMYCGPERCNCGPPNGVHQLEGEALERHQRTRDEEDRQPTPVCVITAVAPIREITIEGTFSFGDEDETVDETGA